MEWGKDAARPRAPGQIPVIPTPFLLVSESVLRQRLSQALLLNAPGQTYLAPYLDHRNEVLVLLEERLIGGDVYLLDIQAVPG